MIELGELQDAAQKAFPVDQLMPERDESWKLIVEMGWLLIELPEAAGGLALGRDAFTTLNFELGRVLSSAPLLPALLTLRAIGASTSLADQAAWIERICTGEFIPVSLLGGRIGADTDASGAIRLTGLLSGVPEADMASHVLIGAQDLQALVPLDAPGLTVTERRIWDRSRRLFDVGFDGCRIDPALIVAQGAEAAGIDRHLQEGLLLGLAADALGGANTLLDITVEYLKTRKQFDRPLAMFQALKHRCADLKAAIAAAEALLWSRANGTETSIAGFGAAKALACDVYRMVTEEAIQLHGGIGLTEEHNCHLFMKRAMLDCSLGADADIWLEAAGKAALARMP